MGLYILALKNLRRNRIRNASTVLSVTAGVLLLLILVGSGIGINSFLDRAQSINSDNQTLQNNSENNYSLNNNLTQYIIQTLGIDIEQKPLLNNILNFVNWIIKILDGIASIVLIIGVLGVYNTMFFNEIERRKEVGLLKIMGFTEKQILLSFALEGTILGLISSLIGVALGIIGIYLLNQLLNIPNLTLTLPLWLIMLSILFTSVLSFLLSLYPAWLASKNGFEGVFNPV
ncbi:MAG: FtsX-like permease family protein [Methanobacteriaceae archaeon]|nr:FtsX-like permease family protein [Methanobacteriaceae archaeon]